MNMQTIKDTTDDEDANTDAVFVLWKGTCYKSTRSWIEKQQHFIHLKKEEGKLMTTHT